MIVETEDRKIRPMQYTNHDKLHDFEEFRPDGMLRILYRIIPVLCVIWGLSCELSCFIKKDVK